MTTISGPVENPAICGSNVLYAFIVNPSPTDHTLVTVAELYDRLFRPYNMNIAHHAREKLRHRVLKRYRYYEALCIVTNRISVNDRKTFTDTKETILGANKSKLQKYAQEVELEIKKLRKHYGVMAEESEILEIALLVEKAPGDSISWIPKTRYRELFSQPERMLTNFNILPEHIFIGIDPGKYRTKPQTYETFLLEAKIFEDLAALFNTARDLAKALNSVEDGKPAHKTAGAIARAAIAYAVFFFEAYLNGIAANHVLSNERNLDVETKGLLLDWDFLRKRPRYLSLRDKAFKYPRIISNTSHSPIQEGDTPELKIILEKASDIRDLIAHPSLRRDVKELEIFFGVHIDTVEEIVDSVIKVVRKIENAVHGDELRLGWLHNRGANGRFPNAVFD